MTHPERSSAAWDAEAEAFDDSADHGLHDPAVRTVWRTLLTQHLPKPPGAVADLGCGTGTLSLLLAAEGYWVDGLDFSPMMLAKAAEKAGPDTTARFVLGDADDPTLPTGHYAAVLCRHVLWAMPDPVRALRRWLELLAHGGTLLLLEGRWSSQVGLSAEETVSMLEGIGQAAQLTVLDDPGYWGRSVADERYLVTCTLV